MTPISTQGWHLESVSLIRSSYALGYFGPDSEQKKLRQVILIMHAHMCIFTEAYYKAVASNLKQEGKEKGHLISFPLWRGRGSTEQQKEQKIRLF